MAAGVFEDDRTWRRNYPHHLGPKSQSK